MLRSVLFMILCLLVPTVSAGASGEPIEPTGIGIELMMVEEDGCIYCARWNREIGPIYPKTSEGKLAPLRRIDKHTKLPSNLSLKRGVFYTPTFVLLVDGAEKGRIEGYPGEDFFWGLLAQMVTSVDKASSVPIGRKNDNEMR